MQCRRFGISKQAHCGTKCGTDIVIFLIRCLKRLQPKFQRLPVVCLGTGDDTQPFLPSGVSSKRFFTGVDFVAVRANFTLYYPGSKRGFLLVAKLR